MRRDVDESAFRNPSARVPGPTYSVQLMRMLKDLLLVIATTTLAGLTGCRESVSETVRPATESRPSATGIVLESARRQQLGIETTPVDKRRLTRTLKRMGWFIAPPGAETVIRSPVAGFVVPAISCEWPQIGRAVETGACQSQVNVFLTPQEVSQLVLAKEDNDVQMRQALVTMELSEAQLALATKARDSLAGVRIDQIREAYERSKAAYQEAQDKLPFLVQEPYDSGVLLKPVPIAPSAQGRILELHVSKGQFVQAGDALWTIGDWSTLWLRVPVFSGDLNRLSPNRPAMVELPGNTAPVLADPLNIPTPVDPHTRTVDLKFTLDNPKWKVRVGQSAVVELPVSDEFEALVIPQSAVLVDGFGQAYCYAAEAGSDVFRRRRIELGTSFETRVAVLRGLAADDVVVSAGAEQLAAEESKSELAVEDDD